MNINNKPPREILSISSVREFLDWLPEAFMQNLILFAFALTAFAPLFVSIKAVSYLRPEYLLDDTGKYDVYEFLKDDFDQFAHKRLFIWVFVLISLAFLLLLLKKLACRKPDLSAFIRNPALVLFSLLSIWMLINIFMVNGPNFYALKGKRPNHENLFIYLEYFFCFFAGGLFLTDRKKNRFFVLFILTSLFLIPFAMILHFSVYNSDFDHICCVFANSNYYGNYLCVVISLCVGMLGAATDKRWKAFFVFCMLCNTAILYFNNTFGAWIGALFACLFAIVAFRIRDGKLNRWTLLALALFLGCLIVCGWFEVLFLGKTNRFVSNIMALFKDALNVVADSESSAAKHAGTGRWAIWKYYLSLVRQHPLFGIGLDGVRALDIGHEIRKARPHNEFLQWAVYLGIPALVFYFSACLSVFLRASKFRRQLSDLALAALVAALGYLAASFFSNTMYNTTPYLFIFLGLGYVNLKPCDRADLQEA